MSTAEVWVRQYLCLSHKRLFLMAAKGGRFYLETVALSRDESLNSRCEAVDCTQAPSFMITLGYVLS